MTPRSRGYVKHSFSWRAISVRILLVFVSIVCPSNVLAWSLPNFEGCKLVRFTPGSADISESYKVELGRLLGRLRPVYLGAFIITGWSDEVTASTNATTQKALAERRATAVRQFLVAHGIDNKIIFSEGKLPQISRGFTHRSAHVEFVGVCQEAYIGACGEITKPYFYGTECGFR
jgi:hypothetical protein